ncbi:MAG TPA: hypothetical protein PKE69_03275 [Pyrinomonadaceae bacterium]|nr:hypothetical protein [Pyrinomonadaceae bacterium]
METDKINLFVFDTKENFENNKKENKNSLGSEGSTFKSIICVDDRNEFEQRFSSLAENEFVFMIVHVFYTKNINGIKLFEASGIKRKYPKLGFMFVSEGDKIEIKKQMLDEEFEVEEVHKYHRVQSNLEAETFKVYTKKEILQLAGGQSANLSNKSDLMNKYPQCDYAIITALEEDEMEKVLLMITKIDRIPNEKHLIEYGQLTNNPNKKIAYASQQATGMIDAAILATELILRFNPKFLIMAGVLGGNPNDVKIGDVIIATRVFTIDKGKLADYGFKKEIETTSNEHAYITNLIRNKKEIVKYIREKDETRESEIDIHFGPIACVRQVIDLEGYFAENITPIDRKTLALEMESYAVSRACDLVNDGKTKALIIKSVMDITQGKVDNAKPYAAWSSAECLKYILENDLI